MMNETKMSKLEEGETMAYFKADLCPSSLESYSLEKKRNICNEMIRTSKAQLDAIRADFETCTHGQRAMPLDASVRSGDALVAGCAGRRGRPHLQGPRRDFLRRARVAQARARRSGPFAWRVAN